VERANLADGARVWHFNMRNEFAFGLGLAIGVSVDDVFNKVGSLAFSSD
jgi:hypothetical protein